MQTPQRRLAAAVAAASMFAACSGSGSTAALGPAPPAGPRAATTVVDGEVDALAAELLLTPHATQDLAVDHLRSVVTAAGGGPGLAGSAAIRALAASSGAPADGNGNGTNLDETLQVEAARIAAFAGATVTEAVQAAPFLPWRRRSAELASRPPATAGEPFATRDLGDRIVLLADAADRLRLAALGASRLLATRARGRFGEQPELGTLGLFAAQQALAAEATMFASLFTGGGPLGGIGDARTYDPRTAPRWLPVAVEVDADPHLPTAAGGYRILDGASELTTVARALDAGMALVDLADPASPTSVPELFRGHPFAPPPHVPTPPTVTWDRDIRPLLTFRCGQCHLQQTFGGFSIANYAVMRTGGNKTRLLNLQFVIPGDAQNSLLHRILNGPPAPFQQMPFNGPQLPAAERALVDAWIDGGALEAPPTPPAPPRAGEDLALVSFGNLVALHLDPATGALHERRERDGVSGFAAAAATGEALRALAHAAPLAARLAIAGTTPPAALAIAADFAATRFVAGDGTVVDAIDLATSAATGPADLRATAALTAGLLAAGAQLPAGHPALAAGRRAAAHLLDAFSTPDGWLAQGQGAGVGTYDAATLAAVLAALRAAALAGVDGADDRRTQLLQRLRPALAFAEWARHGEVLGDGIADTDGDGIPEPGAAGGEFGRLPLLVSRIAIDAAPPVSTTPTWSQHIRPLLLQKCAECHLNGATQGSFSLDTWRSLQVPGESGGAFPLLVPGDPEASFLFRKLTMRQPGLGMQMPLQRTPLDAAAVALVRQWIAGGATGR